ncbi:MAG: type III-B CRISPR module RAMP protein Cmr1 [Verrucomicrobia bacterium]|nr:type III-B CRISPR module RAMP protein Cmr1 [Verrucomicrobiota bacterium]
MKTEPFEFELLTRAFVGGAIPRTTAELRGSSIRGQLRWWFRTLGGFKALAPTKVPEQENSIFGAAAGDSGLAGQLRLQVLPLAPPVIQVIGRTEVQALAGESYLIWPFAQERDGQPTPRACLVAGTTFELRVHWRGDLSLWPSIRALVAVFGHLGSLGARGRRAMGALALTSSGLPLKDCLAHFAQPGNLDIRDLNPTGLSSCQAAVGELARWLRSWRLHGQMAQAWIKTGDNTGYWRRITDDEQRTNREKPGFHFARRDHNEGLDVQGSGATNPDPEQPAGAPGNTYRPALGLPIVQFFSSLEATDGKQLARRLATVEWTATAAGGRFASPVVLRVYRSQKGWHPLVLFLDSRQWDYAEKVHLACRAKGTQATRTVLPDLYKAMKLSLAKFDLEPEKSP